MNFDIFPLNESPTLYKRKMELANTPEQKYDVVCELGGACCYAIHCYMETVKKHAQVPQLLRKLDKVARSIVMGSEGVQDGYRLSDYWLHTLFAQIVLNESPIEKRNEALNHLKRLFDRVGWNYAEGVEPLYNNVNTLMTIEYFRKYNETDQAVESGSFKVVLYPTSAVPVGSVWRAKSGAEYTYIGEGEYEPREVNAAGLYVPIKPTEYQLSKWERLL